MKLQLWHLPRLPQTPRKYFFFFATRCSTFLMQMPEFDHSTSLSETVFLLTSPGMVQLHHIFNIMLPENSDGGCLLHVHVQILDPSPHIPGPGLGQPFAVSLPSSPAPPAACKLYTWKYDFSLLETVVVGCYLPTFREPAMNQNMGLKGEFLNSENGSHQTFPGGDSKTLTTVFLTVCASASNTLHLTRSV